MLLETFIELCSRWRPVFTQERTFELAMRQALGTLCAMGRRTITRIIWFSGREQQQWSSDYRLFSRSPWSTNELFQPVVAATVPHTHPKYIGVGLDDTRCAATQRTGLHKTGRKIESASFYLDPLFRPFMLIWCTGCGSFKHLRCFRSTVDETIRHGVYPFV